MHDIVIGRDTLNPNLENYREGRKEAICSYVLCFLV